jgi:hypothetical protein
MSPSVHRDGAARRPESVPAEKPAEAGIGNRVRAGQQVTFAVAAELCDGAAGGGQETAARLQQCGAVPCAALAGRHPQGYQPSGPRFAGRAVLAAGDGAGKSDQPRSAPSQEQALGRESRVQQGNVTA